MTQSDQAIAPVINYLYPDHVVYYCYLGNQEESGYLSNGLEVEKVNHKGYHGN